MINKQLSHDDLHALLKSSGLAASRPGLAAMILSGLTRFETKGVTYALEDSKAAGEMLTRVAPTSESAEEKQPAIVADALPLTHERELEPAPVVRTPPSPGPRQPVAATGSEALLSLVHQRSSLTSEQRADDDAERAIKNLFDGPEAAA